MVYGTFTSGDLKRGTRPKLKNSSLRLLFIYKVGTPTRAPSLIPGESVPTLYELVSHHAFLGGGELFCHLDNLCHLRRASALRCPTHFIDRVHFAGVLPDAFGTPCAVIRVPAA